MQKYFKPQPAKYTDPLTIHREDYRGNVNTIGIRACYDEGKRLAESIFLIIKEPTSKYKDSQNI